MTDTVNVIARVPAPLRKRLRQAALDEGRSMNEILNEIIEKWLDSQHPEVRP